MSSHQTEECTESSKRPKQVNHLFMHVTNPPSLSFHLPKHTSTHRKLQFVQRIMTVLLLAYQELCGLLSDHAVIGKEQGMSLFDGLSGSVSESLSRVASFTLLYGATCEQSSGQRILKRDCDDAWFVSSFRRTSSNGA